eukprot:TRINITY_DN6962_c0_g1_i1.p1 TRINITY_DN6962_c0_g1~~TRINITY_DN6962_c0_g1_i1.p1  ORF type:complete len:279 (+),score=57.83 TRINITY_DN6962_c0_g1_i1:144-980(+)
MNTPWSPFRYYEFDKKVAKEILIRKGMQKSIRDFDDIKEKTNVRVMSLKRQYENFRRVYKYVEDNQEDLTGSISRTFRISPNRAGDYARFMFLSHHQFEVTKRGYSTLDYTDLDFFAKTMISLWADDAEQLEIDETLLENLRKIRELLYRRDNVLFMRNEIKTSIMGSGQVSSAVRRRWEEIAPGLTKGILRLLDTLVNTRSVKDMFFEAYDNLNEWMRKNDLSADTMEHLYLALRRALPPMSEESQGDADSVMISWEKFLSGIKSISDHLETVWPPK